MWKDAKIKITIPPSNNNKHAGIFSKNKKRIKAGIVQCDLYMIRSLIKFCLLEPSLSKSN